MYLGFIPTESEEYYFVSYNTDDAGRVGPILQKLSAKGAELWYDYGLDYGEGWEETIAERISKSKAVLMFITKDIFQKENSYVKKEYSMARRFLNKTVYVILLDEITNSDVPTKMLSWWIDLTEEQTVNAFSLTEDRLFVEIGRIINLSEKKYSIVSDYGEKYPLKNGENYIGRDPLKSNLVIPHQYISRLHAVITIDRQIILRDLGAANRTYLNGAELAPNDPHVILPGDQIRLGLLNFTLKEE